jgi:hypothetical protein
MKRRKSYRGGSLVPGIVDKINTHLDAIKTILETQNGSEEKVESSADKVESSADNTPAVESATLDNQHD